MATQDETLGQTKTSNGHVANPGGSYVRVKIPSSSNFFGRAIAVVKATFAHPLSTTLIETSDDVKTHKP